MIATDELIIDSFAGGGGASLGMEMALGRSPDIAVNHDPEAIAMHRANHPGTRHYCEDVWAVDPREACGGRPVGLAWFSPDCKHFSKAKGGRPVEKKIRSLAWVVIRWARLVRPRVILLENVEEFADWGPLLDDGTPCPLRRGLMFRRWVAALRKYGYQVESRELVAADFGAPTSRKRLFVVARCDGRPIVWPRATHGGFGLPHRAAAECIMWTIPCPSIFARQRPLAENTLRRIARGIKRYVLEAGEPFIVGVGGRQGQSPERPVSRPYQTITAKADSAIVVPTFWSAQKPLTTITAEARHALVASTIIQSGYGEREGQEPMRRDEVRAFLLSYYSTDQNPQLTLPLPTVTTHDRFGIVTVAGVDYEIADIGLRMLVPRELYRAQGFPDSYQIEIECNGRPLSKAAQVRMCGNSVVPLMARALVEANCAGRAALEVA